MRDYGRVHSRLWLNRRFRAVTDDAKLVYLYTLTCRHGNALGLYRLTYGYIADDINDEKSAVKLWSSQRVEVAVRELSAVGLLSYDEGTSTIFVHRFTHMDRMANGKVVLGAIKELKQLSNGTPFLKDLQRDLMEISELPDFYERLLDHLATVSKPFRYGIETPEPEPDASTKLPDDPPGLPDPDASLPEPEPDFSDGLAADGAEKKQVLPTTATWAAYTAAYRRRYGVAPVRNKTVNSQMWNFVNRLGREIAPHVAEFYLSHNNRYYVAKMHSVAALLADAEKLHTEFRTSTRMTESQAQQADRTQGRGEVFNQLVHEATARKVRHGT